MRTERRVAIYTRVSTTEQAEEGFSLDEQERVQRDYCKSMGYDVYKVYSDKGISGKNVSGRPALKSLLADASKGAFDLVLVWKINRLARNILDLLKMVEQLEKYGVGFKSYSENFDTETPGGKLSLHMMAAVGEFERGSISENVKMGMNARAASEGLWNGGKVLGYDSVGKQIENRKRKDSRLVVNEEEASTVRKIFDLYSKGNGYKAIVSELNREGRKTKRGNDFSVSSIKGILTNPIYIGKIRYNYRKNWNNSKKRALNPNHILVKGEHEAIIDTKVWENVQLLLEKRSGKPTRVYDGEYPLTGILKCPKCGAGMVILGSTRTLKDGTKKRSFTYACGAWKNKGTAVCNSNTIGVDKANEKVFGELSKVVSDETILRKIVENINRERTAAVRPAKEELDRLEKQIKLLDSKKEKAFEAYEEDIISKEEFTERLGRINSEKETISERIAGLKVTVDNQDSEPVDFDRIKSVMENFYEIFMNSATKEQRKQLLHLLIQEITMDEKRSIDSIKIRLNEDIITYLEFNRELDDEKSNSLSFMSTRKKIEGDILLNIAV